MRFLQASLVLAELVRARSADGVERIKREALELYDDGTGNLSLDALAKSPEPQRSPKAKQPEQLPLPLFD